MPASKRKPGRPPKGDTRGKRINLYVTEPREQLFIQAFDLLKEQGKLPSTARLQRSRTEVIDYALDALIQTLQEAGE